MPRFEVSTADGRPVQVEAANWLSALGDGLEALGLISVLERLACEVLPNGRVIARDVRTGQGFVVMPLLEGAAQPAPVLEGEETPAVHPGWDQQPPALVEADTGELPPLANDEEVAEPPTVGEALETDEVTDGDQAAPGRQLRIQAQLERILLCPSTLIAWYEALDAARALVPAESGAALEHEISGGLRFLYAFGPRSSGVQGALLPRGVGIAGFSVERNVSILVKDTRTDERFCADFDDVTGYETRSVICVPVVSSGRVEGCLELLNASVPGGFDDRAVATVEAIAAALARRLSSP